MAELSLLDYGVLDFPPSLVAAAALAVGAAWHGGRGAAGAAEALEGLTGEKRARRSRTHSDATSRAPSLASMHLSPQAGAHPPLTPPLVPQTQTAGYTPADLGACAAQLLHLHQCAGLAGAVPAYQPLAFVRQKYGQVSLPRGLLALLPTPTCTMLSVLLLPPGPTPPCLRRPPPPATTPQAQWLSISRQDTTDAAALAAASLGLPATVQQQLRQHLLLAAPQ